MSMAGLPDNLEQRLQPHGFALVERSSGGPMGSVMLLFTDGIVDISVFDDRGEKGVGLGVRSGITYGIQVWHRVLGIGPAVPASVDGQLAWVIRHIGLVRSTVERDADINERLREMNWILVKERLRLSPDADQDNPRTWRRS